MSHETYAQGLVKYPGVSVTVYFRRIYRTGSHGSLGAEGGLDLTDSLTSLWDEGPHHISRSVMETWKQNDPETPT